MLQFENTDTFGGEANYSWCNRWHCADELSNRQAVRLAKKLAGYTSHPCKVEYIGGDIAIYPRGICQVMFVTYSEEGYEQGNRVNKQGDEVKTFNLDAENEIAEFIGKYGTMKKRALANELGFIGKGASKRANNVSAYAWNKHTAIVCRKSGKITEALQYEAICDRIYSEMDARDKW